MKYFKISEFERSSVAEKAGIDNHIPNEEILNNIKALVDNVLDPAREKLGEPIYISSGYRCNELNKLVLGSKSSQHCLGKAADTYCIHMDKLLEIYKTLIFDQLIIYPHKGFYHISYNSNGKNRMQIIYKYNGK